MTFFSILLINENNETVFIVFYMSYVNCIDHYTNKNKTLDHILI